eukprot:2336136-Rhodomonas_salina.2
MTSPIMIHETWKAGPVPGYNLNYTPAGTRRSPPATVTNYPGTVTLVCQNTTPGSRTKFGQSFQSSKFNSVPPHVKLDHSPLILLDTNGTLTQIDCTPKKV